VTREDDKTRPARLPTTQNALEAASMAATWIREAAKKLRRIGQNARADRLDQEADGAERDAR